MVRNRNGGGYGYIHDTEYVAVMVYAYSGCNRFYRHTYTGCNTINRELKGETR